MLSGGDGGGAGRSGGGSGRSLAALWPGGGARAARRVAPQQLRFPRCITENRELNRPGTGAGYYDVPVAPALAGRSPLSVSKRGWSAFANSVPRPYEDRHAHSGFGW